MLRRAVKDQEGKIVLHLKKYNMNLTLVQGYRVNSPGKGHSNFNLVQNCL